MDEAKQSFSGLPASNFEQAGIFNSYVSGHVHSHYLVCTPTYLGWKLDSCSCLCMCLRAVSVYDEDVENTSSALEANSGGERTESGSEENVRITD